MTRSAVVTGAAMGMGMLMARKLAKRGWRVFAGVMPGLDASELTNGVELTVIEQNVTDQAMVRAGAQQVGRALDGAGLDLLINNAGIANIATGVIEGVDIDEAKRLFDVKACQNECAVCARDARCASGTRKNCGRSRSTSAKCS